MSHVTRIAVVGFGLVGKQHATTIQRIPDVKLAAIVDSDANAQLSAAALGVPTYRTLTELFAHATFDGVILATPTPLHVSQGLTCIEHGCPVLVEKPIAVTSEEAMELTRAAKKKDVALLVGHHRRYNGIVRMAKAAIDGGAVGQLRAIQATCWFYKPDHYFEAAPWRTRRRAGPISVNLVHDVDLLRYFCGEVERVQAHAVPAVRGYENEDLAAAILSFRSGAVATISVADTIAAPWSWELTSRENPIYPATQESCYLVGGTLGSLSIPDLRIWNHEDAPDWWTPISARILATEPGDPLSAQVSHFSQVIQGAVPPMVPGHEGLRSLQVVEAIQQAAETGLPLKIKPLADGLENW